MKARESWAQDWKQAVEERIQAYEKRSRLEFVPMMVSSSGDYAHIRLHLATLTLVLLLVGFHFSPSSWGAWRESLLCLVGAVGVHALLGIPRVLRLFLPMSLRQVRVQEAASLAFLREEVFATEKRSGILIYVSLFEKAVFLMADRGCLQHVPSEEWAQLGARLASDFNRQNPGVTFLSALDEIVSRLEQYFPVEGENPNELSNRLRTD